MIIWNVPVARSKAMAQTLRRHVRNCIVHHVSSLRRFEWLIRLPSSAFDATK